MAGEKDWWDKTDVIGKIVSGVLLAVVALLLQQYTGQIQKNADEKAEKIKKGELLQSLVSDLSQPADRVRRDVALIALNRSVGDEDSALVLEIVEHIFRNTPTESNGEALKVAYRIIEQRNPILAQQLAAELNIKANDPATRNSLISSPDVSSPNESATVAISEKNKGISPVSESQIRAMLAPTEDAPASANARQISAVFPKIAYIQFQGNIARERAEELRNLLIKQGISAPGVERIEGKYQNSIRYFNKEDSILASETAKAVNKFFEQKGCKTEFEPKEFSKFKTPKGQIEVWINLSCPNS